MKAALRLPLHSLASPSFVQDLTTQRIGWTMGSKSNLGTTEEPISRSMDLPDNRFLELKPRREVERADAVRQGLIPDPLKPRRLDEALPFLGTCLDMCPEFERHEREYQNNSDRWERFPGTFRIDPQKAVKAFHRPAAGNDQPLPSDVRPPDVLKVLK